MARPCHVLDAKCVCLCLWPSHQPYVWCSLCNQCNVCHPFCCDKRMQSAAELRAVHRPSCCFSAGWQGARTCNRSRTLQKNLNANAASAGPAAAPAGAPRTLPALALPLCAPRLPCCCGGGAAPLSAGGSPALAPHPRWWSHAGAMQPRPPHVASPPSGELAHPTTPAAAAAARSANAAARPCRAWSTSC